MKKTVGTIAVEVLKETQQEAVCWGDSGLLDMIARRAEHTNLMNLHPIERHARILNYLEKEPRLEKRFYRVRLAGRSALVRYFRLREESSNSKHTVSVNPSQKNWGMEPLKRGI